jgi:hypothetical protein
MAILARKHLVAGAVSLNFRRIRCRRAVGDKTEILRSLAALECAYGQCAGSRGSIHEFDSISGSRKLRRETCSRSCSSRIHAIDNISNRLGPA